MNESRTTEAAGDGQRPTGVFVVRDLDTLRTLADPLRMQVFEHLFNRPLTVKELAARLGLAPGRLYYHINVLEDYGLIHVVDRHLVGNLVEKVYRATVAELDLDPELLSFRSPTSKESIATMVASTLDTTREDLVRSLQARDYALATGAEERPRRIMVTRVVHHIPESRAESFAARLKALLEEFEDAAVDEAWDAEEAHSYAFTVAFYPHFDYPETPEEENVDE